VSERNEGPVAPRLEDGKKDDGRATRHIYRIEIRASAERIWTAITDPEWTVRYGYRGRVQIEPRVGGEYAVHKPEGLRVMTERGPVPAPDVLIQGVVTQIDPPHRLGVRMRFLVDPSTAAEPETHVLYEIAELDDERCSLTIVHDLTRAPRLAKIVSGDFRDLGAGGGHPLLLTELKRLLETD